MPDGGASRPPLARRGICYDTGTEEIGGGLSRVLWTHALMAGEVRAIREELHCNAIEVSGTDIDRLLDTATTARQAGLHVTLQPRLFDHPQEEVLEHLTDVARQAEALRDRLGEVTLNVGCEFSLFAPGIIPGATAAERIVRLGTVGPPPDMNHKLNDLLGRARAAARRHFGGELTYAAGEWEAVDWRDFDVVGLDHYRSAENEASYVDTLRSFNRLAKPIAITEFGCCTYEGADARGGSGYDIIDWSRSVPQLAAPVPARSEQTQAKYLLALLDIFAAEKVFSVSVYQFITPGMPHSAEARFDFDRASFAVTKVIPEDPEDPASPYRWERKLAFDALASYYRAAAGG